MNHIGRICDIQKTSYLSRFLFLASIIVFILTAAPSGYCESTTVDVIPDATVDGSVELTPGYISGTIGLGGQDINRIDLSAESADYYARIYPAAEGPYAMTVNVPVGTSLEYTVSGSVWMDNWSNHMYFKDRTTMVQQGSSSQLDIIINPGYVSVKIVPNGCTLVKSQVYAVLNANGAYSNAYTDRGSESSFRFPVQPNSSIEVYGQTQLSTGKTITLERKSIDVVAGADIPVTWELNCGPGLLGAIEHDVDYHMDMDYHYTYLYNQGAWSPSRTVNHTGRYLFDNIAPDTWRLYTYSFWNNRHNYIAKDLTDISVAEGVTTHVPVNEYPGFLKGRVTLSGTKTIHDTDMAYLYAYGRNAMYPSYRTNSRALIENTEGSFDLALLNGEWNVFLSTYHFRDTAPGGEYLYSQLYMYDYDRYYDTVTVSGSQTIQNYNLDYKTGSATIKYTRSDGGDFNSPYLYAKSYNRDESGKLTSYIYSYSRGASDSDNVTFVGFPGTYEVDAWAYVDGSMTTFGKAIVEIVAGVEKVVDLGGPELTVITPVPDTVFTENSVVVSGTATDDTGVAWVSVSGVEAALESTGNPDDPNEVSFSVELTLFEGENILETIAADSSSNLSADTRSVTYESPETSIVPALVDIKPGSCKNPFNVASQGVLPAAIIGSESLNISDIDPFSVRLMDVAALRSSVEDVTDKYCDSVMPDGYNDLALKFDRQEIVTALGDVSDGDVITLTLTGKLYDGTEFSGEDIVTILVRGKQKKK